MNSRTAVVNISGDFEESLVQFARHLGTNQIRRKLFLAIYGRGDKPKSKRELMALSGIERKGTNEQQAQNELDHLAKHHLIVKSRSDKRLDDGSRNQYAKDPTVRANKDRIIRLADNPVLAARIPTKRQPRGETSSSLKRVSRAALRKRKMLKVLYLESNADRKSPLRTDVEVRRVQDAIRASRFRDSVTVEYRPAADLRSLIEGLNDIRPTVVHFSGHSDVVALSSDNQDIENPGAIDISYVTFARALKATDSPPQVVVLNSCESISSQTDILSTTGILIGMNAPISDIAAATFAPNFYAALASGQSVRAAYEQARIMVEQVSIGEDQIIELAHAVGIDPSRVKLT